jgi:hypothetical protein
MYKLLNIKKKSKEKQETKSKYEAKYSKIDSQKESTIIINK